MSKFDLNQIFKQAKDLQSTLDQQSKNLENVTVEGQSGAGLVKITCNGKHDILKVELDPEIMQEDKAILEELIAAAANDAMRRVEKASKDHMLDLAKEMKFNFNPDQDDTQ